ncbi:MAG: hypothetical protein MR905_04825 [Prevotella sp.]|nr:hypothetical protein [Prevotella sp.]
MRHPFYVGALLALLGTATACQESLPERCQREAREYTAKKCPAAIDEFTVMDSLTFDAPTLTLHYYYSLRGSADDPTRVGQMQESLRKSLIDQVKNSTQLKAYKDEGYNFAYTYHSARRPQLVLYSLKVTAADYQ